MSVKGKKEWQWVARTLCDFGNPNRRSELSKHYSLEAANRAFPRLVRIYGDIHHWRVWQEDRAGKILNDTAEYVPTGRDVGNRSCRMVGGR